MGIADLIETNQDTEGMLLRSLQRIIQLYTDKSHFIYELLQNAEDAGASEILFLQTDNGLEVFHDGRPFTIENLSALCDIGMSSKARNFNQIGEFGVGFKSVFSICERVQVYSRPSEITENRPAFSIEIQNFIKPIDIDNEIVPEGYTTRFVFPYCAGKDFSGYKSVSDLKSALNSRLSSLGCDTLLFMHHLKTIKYRIQYDECNKKGSYKLVSERINYFCNQVRFYIDDVPSSIKYLRYTKNLPSNTQKSVDIAYQIQTDKNGKDIFVPTDNPFISVYFPTETESKLSFIVQGPYRTTPNRSSIPFDDRENMALAELTSSLLKESVLDIKDRGNLTLSFLALLPFKYPERIEKWLFSPLLDMTVSLFEKEKILPTVNGTYVNAENAVIARSQDLVDVFHGKLLTELIPEEVDHYFAQTSKMQKSVSRYKTLEWLPTALTETSKEFSILHNFLSVNLHIRTIRPDDLYRYLSKNIDFFRRRNDLWFDLFYNFMQKLSTTTMLFHKASSVNRGSFLSIPFLKTNTGRFEAPYTYDRGTWTPNVYLPDNNSLKGVRYVDRSVYERHHVFINSVLGLGKPDTFLHFCQRLRKNYKKRYSLDDQSYIDDINECIQYLSRDEYKEKMREELKDKDYIKCIDEGFCNPRIDKCSVPNTLEGVSASDYYHGIGIRIVDTNYYEIHGIALESLSLFGVWTYIAEDRYSRKWVSSFSGNAQEKDEEGFYSRLNFQELYNVISYIEEHPNDDNSRHKSQIIMELLFIYERNIFGNIIKGKTIYAREQSVASVIQTLCYRRWLFTKERQLQIAQAISKYDLDVSLYGQIRSDSKIYNALGFVSNEKDKTYEAVQLILNGDHPVTKVVLDELLQKKYNISVDTLEKLITGAGSTNSTFEFPQRPIVNLQRLKESVANLYHMATPVKYNEAMRRIRVSEQDHVNRSYLKVMYGSESHNDFCACQMCEQETRYPMAIQLENDMNLELQIMYLSLCPNCAAAYKFIRADKQMLERFISNITAINVSQEEEPIRVKFGDRSIAFTATHIAEVQQAIWLKKHKFEDDDSRKIVESNREEIHNDCKKHDPSDSTLSAEDKNNTFVFSRSYGSGEILEFDDFGRAKIKFEDGKIREILFDYYKSKGEIDYVSPHG